MSTTDGYSNPEALVSTEWLAAHLDEPGYRLIEVDVNPAVYESGHIPGAVGWDWKRDLQDPTIRDLVSREALARKLGESGVTPETTVLLYGDNNNWFAAYAYWALKYYGHDRVKLVNGGRVRWEVEGRPYTTEPPRVQPVEYRFAGEPREELRACREQVLERIGRAGLVDVRSPAEFSGELLAPENLPQEGAQRGGHIPTAVNVPWAQAVKEDGTFKDPQELRQLYGSKGVSPDREVIAYCRIGERSAHTWFVLHELLGYPNVRNYDGSWTEWGSSVRMPIER
ncbi:MAG TPA: sulfurtransferase [Candidatus Dormibacteraeota bacterium]|nr:sulfurtransferase [Candidatus Dormibacteraeota bacterium]